MLENFNDDKRKNSMTQFSDFHTGWSIYLVLEKVMEKREDLTIDRVTIGTIVESILAR